MKQIVRFVKKHWLYLLLGLVAICGLVWWFMRGRSGTSDEKESALPPVIEEVLNNPQPVPAPVQSVGGSGGGIDLTVPQARLPFENMYLVSPER